MSSLGPHGIGVRISTFYCLFLFWISPFLWKSHADHNNSPLKAGMTVSNGILTPRYGTLFSSLQHYRARLLRGRAFWYSNREYRSRPRGENAEQLWREGLSRFRTCDNGEFGFDLTHLFG